MRHALHAEWTKLRTLPSNVWLTLATVVLTVAASVAATVTVDTSNCPSPAECFEDTVKLSLTGVWLGQVAVVVLAVGMIGGEYGTGLIRLTLAAQPRRHTVLLAKAAVLTGIVCAAGALGVLGALGAGRIFLPGNGFSAANGYPPLSLSDPATLRAAVGTVLYLVLVGLLALGVAVAVRETAAAVTTVLALLFVTPVVTGLVTDPDWHDRLDKLTPTNAGLAIQATTRLAHLPIAPWAGLGVLAAWSAAALLLGGTLLSTRDQ
ncbi:MAG: ABC transporter permease subunit [Actinophytocola sp.]|uniref:ABC transporter permease subunit n=1 Tax=Actinophytocola sp. TaxID=1872138 RepID=UPI001322E712|nr:ABC transporter permease subunit [Actinophytocola sp.]MPZ85453.1 ABC transporter permease subunit [Actinophytocola sp.]